ncbi:hypothetical protein KCTC32516_00661 [Polaribacter huanghezhanensis]|uniref:hypothetical protein n=1 Tax=Polaribacter huanghezhanensis TaxID=1354726 RepID=UPI0026471B79|nr:hypothetical protein [Polaribacter huanghezhanensis]WKD85321.1 hypothetical protein KCTC32516_00661 [Polaribacter huanghezhanensis]
MFTSPFKNITAKTKKKLTFSLFYLFIISAVVLKYFNVYLDTASAPYGIFSFEMAGNLDKSMEIINSWSPLSKTFAGLSLGYDFFFLLIYTLFISLLIHKVNERLWIGKPFYKIGKLLIWGMFFSAICDVAENVSLIKLLIGSYKQYWSSIAFTSAIVKFTMIGISLLYLISNTVLLLFKKSS